MRSLQSQDTRQRIVAAAERLFAATGFDGATMRELTTQAKANLAAVNYHFGSKAGLLEEVFRTYFAPIQKERLRLLEEAEARAGGQPLPIREILQMFLAPAVHALSERHTGIPSLLSRLHHEPSPAIEALIHKVSQPVAQRYVLAVQRSLPHLSVQQVHLRAHFMVGAMLYVHGPGRMLMRQTLPDSEAVPDSEVLLNALLEFCEAGFRSHA